MASVLGIIDGGHYVKNPVLVGVTSEALTGNVSFHKVMVEVRAALSTDSEYTTRVCSAVVPDSSRACPLVVDISSALRAVADSIEYEPTTLDIPCVQYSLKAWDEYMKDGEIHDVSEVSGVGGVAYMGGYTDRERILGSYGGFSTKPDTPEVVGVGESVVVPNGFTTSASYDVTASGANTLGRSVYAVPSDKDRYELRFVNSRGLIESVSMKCMVQGVQKMEQKENVRAMQETMRKFSRMSIRKTSNTPSLKMNSGPLDKAWLRWFVEEFLVTQDAWIKIDGAWLHCNVTSEDSISTVNRMKREILSLDFEIKLDFNGAF